MYVDPQFLVLFGVAIMALFFVGTMLLHGRIMELKSDVSSLKNKEHHNDESHEAMVIEAARLDGRLRSLEDKLIKSSNAPPTMRFIVNKLGVITDCTENVAVLLGFEKIALMHKTMDAIIPVEFRSAHASAFNKRASDLECRKGSYIIPNTFAIHAMGGVVPVRTQISEQIGKDGEKEFVAEIMIVNP